MRRTQWINFKAPNEVEFKSMDDTPPTLRDCDFEVATEYSIVSSGTEMAILRGTEDWAPLPFNPGYGALGRVSRIGAAVKTWTPGDRVFFHGPHRTHSVLGPDAFAVRVPEDLDPKIAVFARMAQVAFTSVRVSRPELGDVVAVQGLGLVGNLAAQLMKLSGCTVIGLDLSERRLATAQGCGIDRVVNTGSEDAGKAIHALTNGNRCDTVLEATGVPTLAAQAARLVRQHGELVLLGTPRGSFSGDATGLLRNIHIADTHVTVKGAHEWIFPPRTNPFMKHSLERNVQQIFSFMQDGRLRIKELLTHVASPAGCSTIYAGLRERQDAYVGVVFDWGADPGRASQ